MVESKRPTGASSGEDPNVEPPEVIDLRGHEERASGDESVGAMQRTSTEAGPAPSSGSLTANEWWDWASLTQKIYDAQHQARWPNGGATRRTTDSNTQQPATGRLSPDDWTVWVELGRKISQPRAEAVSTTDDAKDLTGVLEGVDAAPDAASETDEAAAPETAAPDAPEPAPDVPAYIAEARGPAVRHESAAASRLWPPGAATPAGPAVVVEHKAATVRSARRRAGLLGLAALGLGVLLVLLVANQPGRGQAPGGEADALVLNAATVRWLEGNVAPGARVLAPPQLVPQLQRGLPRRTIIPYGDAAKQSADLVIVSTSSERPPTDGTTRSIADRAVPVAMLGDGTLEMREVVSTRQAASNAAAARRSAGRELVRRLALRLTPAAWSELINGKVDARLMTTLERLSGQHTLDIADFPADPVSQKAHAPGRTVVLTAIDGSPVGPDGSAAATMSAALKSAFGEASAKADVRQSTGKLTLVLLYPLQAHDS